MKIRKLVIALFALAPLFFSLTGCSRPVALVEPSFQVPNGSSATVQEVIRQALLGRRWSIQEKLPDGYIAQYNRRPDVWARIKVTHVGRQVTIRYVDSAGLKYDKNRFGSVSVSRWYRTWVLNLESDIKFQVGATVVS
jgi:hypothetical protein